MFANKYPAVDPTIHLPRLLCLHGGGTNSRIFRMQCRILERQLRSAFRLVYAEAPYSCSQPGSDVTSVYRNYGPFKAWLPMFDHEPYRTPEQVVESIDSSLSAAMCVDDLLGATGEWVGLIGFSQGAKVAASLLFAQQNQRKRFSEAPVTLPDFRFGLIIAGRGPLVWMETEDTMPQGLVDAATLSTSDVQPALSPFGEHILQIPTIHVHGLKDPGLELHHNLLERYCDPTTSCLVEWEGDHRIPIKTQDVTLIVEQVFAMAQKTGVLSQIDDMDGIGMGDLLLGQFESKPLLMKARG